MIHSESAKLLAELFTGLKKKFRDKLSEEDYAAISEGITNYIREIISLMREGKSAHEKFFSDIILNSIDAIIGYDKDNKIFLWNKGAEKLFGYTKEEIQERDYTILVPKDKLEKGETIRINEEIEEKGFISNYETERITKYGKIKNVSISRFKIFKDKNEYLGIVSITRDITKEKQLERELREKENLALIGEVVSSIAHNLSNPLNIISGNADYLLLDKKESDEGYEELKVIVEETTRITKSIRQILNFAKPLAPMREIVDLNSLLEDVARNTEFLTQKENISIDRNYCPSLPQISLDKELIKDVFLNIVNNSIQAIKTAKRKGVLKLKTDFKNKNIIVSISDNGTGIDKDTLKNIFKPFFTTKGYGKGTGLGLAFADRVIKEHKGRIEVSSELGQGTTFEIHLPVFTI